MTQHEIQRTTVETLQGRNMTRKPKNIRGVVRTRNWKTGKKKETTRTAWQADFGVVNGKRLMKSFDTKAEADNWLREQTLLHENQGAAAFAMTENERLDAVKARDELREIGDLPKASLLEMVAKTYRQCRNILKGCNADIEDACSYYAKHKEPTGERRTVNEVMDEYIEDAKTHNLRPSSIKDIKHRLERFVMRFDRRLITEITRRDAKAWTDSLKNKSGKHAVSESSKRHASIIAHGMFNFAIDKGYVTENPFTEISKGRRKHREDEQMPECLSWKQVTKIMQAAGEHEPSMLPALAIGFFAGLRTAELRGLDWKDVDLASNRITVMPEVAKKRRARHVEIEANLLAWLLPYRQESGLVAPSGEKWRSRLDNVREQAKVKWPHNAMRHSYASHHLAKYGDPVKTAFALGHHHDTGMLFEHYRALTTPEDGAKYFEIRPETEAKMIAFPASA